MDEEVTCSQTTSSTTGKYHTISEPVLSDWSCELFGTGPKGIVFTPLKGCEPNWFWRVCQRVCFGNKWVKR